MWMFSFGLDFWAWLSKAGLILETYLRIVELFPLLMVETPCINSFDFKFVLQHFILWTGFFWVPYEDWISKAGLILEAYLTITDHFLSLMVETPCIDDFLIPSLSYNISTRANGVINDRLFQDTRSCMIQDQSGYIRRSCGLQPKAMQQECSASPHWDGGVGWYVAGCLE